MSFKASFRGGNVREGLAAYYGSQNRAENLAYADRVLKAAGPSLSVPSDMPSQATSQSQTAGIPALPAGFTLDGAPSAQSQSNTPSTPQSHQQENRQALREGFNGVGKGALQASETIEHAIAPKDTFFGSGDPDIDTTATNDEQRAGKLIGYGGTMALPLVPAGGALSSMAGSLV
jgi:hypothetical protein